MKTATKRAAGPTAALLAVFLLFFLALRYSAQVRQGLSDAVALCASVMVPSLFPMLILSAFAAACPCPAWLQRLSAQPLRALFGLSPGCAAPLLLGLTGGYPLAARSASAARREGLISAEDARRLTLCFTCPGLPFTVVAVGEGFYRSKAIGLTLFAACAAADLLTAALYRLIAAKPTANTETASHTAPAGNADTAAHVKLTGNAGAALPPTAGPIAARLVGAVEQSIRSMLSVCAWIGAFYAVMGMVSALPLGQTARYLSLFAEVTGAVNEAAGMKNVPLTAFCLAFGGVCVFCQLLPDIGAHRVGAIRFLAARLLCGGLAYLIETALLQCFSLPVPTQTRLGTLYLSADTAAGSAALLFLCAVFMAETARPRAGIPPGGRRRKKQTSE